MSPSICPKQTSSSIIGDEIPYIPLHFIAVATSKPAPKPAAPVPVKKSESQTIAPVIEELTAEQKQIEEEFFAEANTKEHINLVFIGHVGTNNY
jgi:hypothetical protein